MKAHYYPVATNIAVVAMRMVALTVSSIKLQFCGSLWHRGSGLLLLVHMSHMAQGGRLMSGTGQLRFADTSRSCPRHCLGNGRKGGIGTRSNGLCGSLGSAQRGLLILKLLGIRRRELGSSAQARRLLKEVALLCHSQSKRSKYPNSRGVIGVPPTSSSSVKRLKIQ